MKKLAPIAFFMLCVQVAAAQSVTIDPKGNLTPILDIKSTTEGMVMPKMTVTQRNVITGLTAGTQVYCTDCTPYGPYYWDGGSWVAMFQTTTVSPITYTVGQAAQGGIVFWIDPASGGQHGLAAGTYDIFGGTYWDARTPLESHGALKMGFYGGAENTRLMLESKSWTGIAYDVGSYTGGSGSYGDWYVPAFEELKLMYTLRSTIGGFNLTYKY